MRKAVFVLILILGFGSGLFCQTSGVTTSPGPEDLIVVLDTSASMSNSYRETSDYLTGPFLREFLRIGDTFHLISFSSAPKLEISRRVEGVGDVETVVARLLLMYPLDPESNLGAALSFSENYASSLPGGKTKRIVLFTDEDAPDTQNLVSAAQSRLRGLGTELRFIKVPVTGNGPSSGRPAQTAASRPSPGTAASPQGAVSQPVPSRPGSPAPAQSQATQGITAPVQQLPSQGTAAPSSGGAASPEGAVSQPLPSQPDSPAPAQSQTAQGIAAPGVVPPPPQTSSGQGASSSVSLQSGSPVQSQGTGQASGEGQTGTTAPIQSTPGTGDTPVISQPPSSSSQPEVSAPSTPPPSTSRSEAPSAQAAASGASGLIAGLPPWLFILLAALALLVLALLIFFLARRLHNSPNQAMARAAGAVDQKDVDLMGSYADTQRSQMRPPLEQRPQERKPLPKDRVYNEAAYENNGPLMLNLFVADQNTAIGRRNIHSVKSGYTFSVGGGKSDFLVFLVPLPPHIADVQYDGRNCTFIPRKPQYFPDIGSQQVPNCIGKTIRVISDKNYELHICIERYEDPLMALNKMLNSITVPGPVV